MGLSRSDHKLMKWLSRTSPFHQFTNPCVGNQFILGHGVVIYYVYLPVRDRTVPSCC